MQNNFSLSVEEDVFTHVIENTDLSPEGLKKWKKEVLFFFFLWVQGFVSSFYMHIHKINLPLLHYTTQQEMIWN